LSDVTSVTDEDNAAMQPSRRLRIAYVTETWPPELNGVALTVERTVRFLGERGHAVDVIRPRQPADADPATDPVPARRLLTAGCVIPMYPDLRFGLALPGGLGRRFDAERPELVHLATPGPLAWAALAAARARGIAVTSDFRTNFHQYAGHYGLGFLSGAALGLLRRFHNLTARTFVPTRATEAALADAGFHRLARVGRGVDTVRFDPAKRSAALRAAWGAGQGPTVLLALGRVAAEKNIGLALEAWRAAAAARPGTQLVVVGDGPARARLAQQHPEVRFVGAKRGEELAAHVASADVFLFPSLTDTFGNVVLEALASGLPVAAFDTAAAAEHVADGASGRLAVPGDRPGFVAAAVALAQAGDAERAAQRAAARATAVRIAWPDVLERFEGFLLSTVTAHEATHERVPVVA
jgi:glycosyltransferase involved in cell wall biosynthesis